MDKGYSPIARPTSKRALRRISIISVLVTMVLIWLLLSTPFVLALRQYAQKNLDLAAATMIRTLEAVLVLPDSVAATETLAALGQQGQFSVAEVRNENRKVIAIWRYNAQDTTEKTSGAISHWLSPQPVTQPILHNGNVISEVRLTARDSAISHFIYLSLAVLAGCILLASGTTLMLTRHLYNGVIDVLQSITEVIHDVRTNRNSSRRVSEERIEEFHLFALDFNSLLDEMEEWQLKLQVKNAQLLRTILHDPLTDLANRATFRSSINVLMNDDAAHSSSALLFLDGDNFKFINDTWGHAMGDRVLTEVVKRLSELGGSRHYPYRLDGDEFAMVLYSVHSEREVQWICAALSQESNRPFDLYNDHLASMMLNIGSALTWEHASAEKLQELADQNTYQVKHLRSERTIKK